jgi:hypothetical protein
MQQITPQNLAPILTETLGEYVSEELCAKMSEKQQRLCYVKSTYTPVDKLIIRQILETVKKKVEIENTVLRQDAISQLKGDKNKEKIFNRLINFTYLENQDNSLRQLIQ